MTPRWATLSGSAIGSAHVRDQLPLQDAVLTWSDPDSARAVIAVADGHGHHLHFRSDTGAALAVVSAVEGLRRALPAIAELGTPDRTQDRTDRARQAKAIVEDAAAAILEDWVRKVGHHLNAHPYTAAEDDNGASADPLRAYGSTLIAAAAVEDLLFFVQVGDGDAVVVGEDGVASRPLPEDPDHDGIHTSSLCQARPLDALRVACLDSSQEPVGLVFLCTDGFGRSRVDAQGWWRQTGEQLLDFSRTRGLTWVRDQLDDWLAEPALIGGDDTTMALLVRTLLVDRPDLVDTVPAPQA
ncbi:MAG: protein phosphatase 2C domain-containing protein [Nocardioidaceae bacterium]|nr:protein phosphatase 2C domain-containing protein [Nocardioidaceae bacterium]